MNVIAFRFLFLVFLFCFFGSFSYRSFAGFFQGGILSVDCFFVISS